MNRRSGGYHFHNGGGSPSSLSLVRTQPRTTFPTKARTTTRSISTPVRKMELALPNPEELARDKFDKALLLLRETARDFSETKSGKAAKNILEKEHHVSLEQKAIAKLDEEEEAEKSLELVKWLMNKKMNSSAKKRIQDLVEHHPNTKAAEEAKALLEQLK